MARTALPCLVFILITIMLFAGGCSEEPSGERAAQEKVNDQCLGCHQVELDPAHHIGCVTCHTVRSDPSKLPFDHGSIVLQPAHPNQAQQSCGGCHPDEVAMVADNPHYTLHSHITIIRQAFGADHSPTGPLELESREEPATPLQLVDDLLRRRCLRCHVYYEGDAYGSVTRATGCGACHLAYRDGALASHRFQQTPADERCLSCHYGNHVGFDYYGRFEHDFNEEYRTPYRAKAESLRPYGVEYHQLQADSHQQAGMLCIDCHKQQQVMGQAAASLLCADCHDPASLEASLPDGVSRQDGSYLFSSKAGRVAMSLPVLSHPAHALYREAVTCQGCHAQWVFNDQGTHLVRLDHDDFFELGKLTVDSSSEVEHILSSHFKDDGALLEPSMTDKFTGAALVGIWLKGYGQRRWEGVRLAPDQEGRLTTVRPILDLYLSWVDLDETLRYDTIRPDPEAATSLPYTPHTTGAAGIFYEQRLKTMTTEPDPSLPATEPDEAGQTDMNQYISSP